MVGLGKGGGEAGQGSQIRVSRGKGGVYNRLCWEGTHLPPHSGRCRLSQGSLWTGAGGGFLFPLPHPAEWSLKLQLGFRAGCCRVAIAIVGCSIWGDSQGYIRHHCEKWHTVQPGWGFRLGRAQHRPDSTFRVVVKPNGDRRGRGSPAVPLPKPSCGQIVPTSHHGAARRRRGKFCRTGATKLSPSLCHSQAGGEGASYLIPRVHRGALPPQHCASTLTL